MEKQAMTDNLEFRLGAMGMPYQKGAGADFTIQTEFLDASWGAGTKKIEYSASAFLNETDRTLYFWELTKESGSGLFFGGDSETSFQSGTTLFRKIKSVGYGPDGKAYEYTLDLGAITKAFKEAAQQYGWKFKVVFKRDKASYPPGYAPYNNTYQPLQASGQMTSVGSNNPQPVLYAGEQSATGAVSPPSQSYNIPQANISPQQSASLQQPLPQQLNSQQKDFSPQQPYQNPQGAFYAQGEKKTPTTGKTSVLFWVFFAILACLDMLLLIGGSGVIFFGLAALLLVIMFGLRNSLSRGFIKPLLCFVGALLITLIIFAFTGTGGADKTKTNGAASGRETNFFPPAGLDSRIAVTQNSGAVSAR